MKGTALNATGVGICLMLVRNTKSEGTVDLEYISASWSSGTGGMIYNCSPEWFHEHTNILFISSIGWKAVNVYQEQLAKLNTEKRFDL